MATYQYVREPLTQEEATRLANACTTGQERLAIWTLLDTGLRASEFASLTRAQIDWQARRIMIYGKGGPYGKSTKRRVVPMSTRIRPLLEHHFALNDDTGITRRTLHRIVKRVANRAGISRECSPHVLRHTFAVTALHRRISLPSLQRMLGHDHIETTMIYLNLAPADVISEYEEKW